MIFKSSFGMIKDNYLMLTKLDSDMIILDSITEITICEKQAGKAGFFNYFRKRMYDFTIIINNREEIKFSFSKKSLNKAIAFKNRILHTKFSLGNPITEEKTDSRLDYRF